MIQGLGELIPVLMNNALSGILKQYITIENSL